MAKIERNEPCPCGSGQKYNQCCMGKEEPEARIVFGKRNYHWSTEEIARFSTDEIIGALKRLGVRFNAERFAKDTKGFFSACKLAEHWASQGPFGASGYDLDFPWMACIVLWERLAPDLLCWEKIDDLIEHGYAASKRGKPVEACEKWLKAWKNLEPRFPVETKNIDDAEEALSNMSCEFRFTLFEWCVDFIGEFEKAASKDPRLHEKRIGFSREFLTLFPDSEELMVYLMGKSEAEALFLSGRAEEGEEAFRSLAEKLPRWEWVYVSWSEMYASPGRKELPLDLEKAEKILRTGLERVADGKEELIERLEEIGKLSSNSAF
jgi:tetratricopeptide (TPR) repeat protein